MSEMKIGLLLSEIVADNSSPGVEVAPWPKTTSIRITPQDGSLISLASLSILNFESIMGWARPTVIASSPKSIKACEVAGPKGSNSHSFSSGILEKIGTRVLFEAISIASSHSVPPAKRARSEPPVDPVDPVDPVVATSFTHGRSVTPNSSSTFSAVSVISEPVDPKSPKMTFFFIA